MRNISWESGEVEFSYDERNVSLADVFNQVKPIPIDCLDVRNYSPTVLYSGMISTKKTSEIVPLMDNVRCIDKTTTGRFLADQENETFDEYLKTAIRNEIQKGTFDYSLTKEFMDDVTKRQFNESTRYENFFDAAKLALPSILYHPTRGLWAKVSERFVKAIPNESDVMLLIPRADPGRTFAKVELPTALATFDDNHRFGGFSAIRLKKLQERCNTKAVFDLLVSNAQKEEAFFCEKFPTDSLSNAQFAETIQKVLLAFDQHRQKMELEKFGGTPLKEEKKEEPILKNLKKKKNRGCRL